MYGVEGVMICLGLDLFVMIMMCELRLKSLSQPQPQPHCEPDMKKDPIIDQVPYNSIILRSNKYFARNFRPSAVFISKSL